MLYWWRNYLLALALSNHQLSFLIILYNPCLSHYYLSNSKRIITLCTVVSFTTCTHVKGVLLEPNIGRCSLWVWTSNPRWSAEWWGLFFVYTRTVAHPYGWLCLVLQMPVHMGGCAWYYIGLSIWATVPSTTLGCPYGWLCLVLHRLVHMGGCAGYHRYSSVWVHVHGTTDASPYGWLCQVLQILIRMGGCAW